MKFFKKASTTANTTTALKSAAATARKVETCKNVLAVYGGIRLAMDIVNAVRVAKLIKAGKIQQGEDGYWYYTDTDSQVVEEGGDEEEAQ